ncbi:MAG: hypothetical protein B1H08_06460 [Candidatus Omnitrophica bacterium 4484_171]|nr:MAG: hypothetical protein B1H08_06460 [Candidatus Omnitrophica bacterium 4484_171]
MKNLFHITVLSLFLLSVSLSIFAGSAHEEVKNQAREYRQQGYKLQSAGNMKEALVYYQKAAQLYPEYKDVFNDMGVVYESMGNKKKALAMYNKALKIDSNYLPAYTNLALFYEVQGNIEKAVYYWHQRYAKGRKGEYWREEAKKRLLKLGTYPEVRREVLESEAIDLSRNVVYKREQKRLKDLEEANLHFNTGQKLFKDGDYTGAMKELEAAIHMSSGDKNLQMKISNMYALIKNAYRKKKIKHYINDALINIDDDDYIAAEEKIKKAVGLMPHFSR